MADIWFFWDVFDTGRWLVLSSSEPSVSFSSISFTSSPLRSLKAVWPSRPVITGSIKAIYHLIPHGPPPPGRADSVAAGLRVTSEGDQRTQTHAQDTTSDLDARC